VKVLCLVTVNVSVTKYAAKMSNMTDLWLSGAFYQALNIPKLVFGWGSEPDPAGGAYDSHFSRVDFLLCEDDTALQNSTADPRNKTSSQNV